MRQLSKLPVLFVIATVAACAPAGTEESNGAESLSRADVAVSWNERILAIAEAEDGFLTLKGVRSAAMMHLAMHEALVALDPRFEPFRLRGVQADADPVAAANEAAWAIAISQYPDRADELNAERMRWQPESLESAEAARAIGQQAAAAILQAREGDGWDADAVYQWHPMGPGVYAEFSEHSGTPDGFVFGAGWAAASPFLLDSVSQFRSPPPPDIGSEAYARAFAEVKSVGSHTSKTRTADQSHLAMWWKQFVEKSHNRLARELVTADGLDLASANRMFALLNMSIFDGYVASFDGKFFYNHWRPYTAIRWASNDGNPATQEDPDWTNLHDHTYAFPSYPSAHGTVCAAAMTVLASVFGENRPFDMTIREADSGGPMSERIPLDPATRSFDSFAQAAGECAMSRVYLGIHFRYDSEEGTRLGRKVGDLAVRDLLQPVH